MFEHESYIDRTARFSSILLLLFTCLFLLPCRLHAGIDLVSHTGDRHPVPYHQGLTIKRFEQVHLNDFDDVAYIALSDYGTDTEAFLDPGNVEILHRSVLGGLASIVSDNLHNYDEIDFANGSKVVYATPEGIYSNQPSLDRDKPFHQPPGQVIGEEDDTPFDRNAVYGEFYEGSQWPRINNHGEVAFTVGLKDREGDGLFRSYDVSAFSVAIGSDAAPGANAEYDRFEDLVINDKAQIAANVYLKGASVDASNSQAVYLFEQPQPGQTAHLVARTGALSPTRSGDRFTGFSLAGPALGPDGQVFFHAELSDGNGNESGGLFRYQDGALEELVSTGDVLTNDSDAPVQFLAGSPEVANSRILFSALVGNPVVPSDALYLRDSQGTHLLMREGQDVPNGDGRFSHLQSRDLNGSGEVAFKVGLLGTSQDNVIDDPGPNEAIFFRDDQGQLTEIIREGQMFLGRRVERVFLAEGSPNDDGRVAFTFQLNVVGGFEGLAVWSEGGINHVSNGHFEDRGEALSGWTHTGAGTAVVSSSSDSGDRHVQLVSGSSVSITQQTTTPQEPLEIAFEFQFVDEKGELTVLLDQTELAVLEASDYPGTDGMTFHSIKPEGLTGLLDVPLTFTFDSAVPGNRLRLDDISLKIVPEPTVLAVLLAGLALIGRKRRQHRAA